MRRPEGGLCPTGESHQTGSLLGADSKMRELINQERVESEAGQKEADDVRQSLDKAQKRWQSVAGRLRGLEA